MDRIRSSERRQTVDYWHVVDAVTGAPVGRAVDFSGGGLKIHGNSEIAKGQKLKVRLEVPAEIVPAGFLILELKSRWSRQVHGHSYFATGFEIVHESPEALAAIRKMMDTFSYVVNPPETLD